MAKGCFKKFNAASALFPEIYQHSKLQRLSAIVLFPNKFRQLN
jgi:hypothetical protein